MTRTNNKIPNSKPLVPYEEATGATSYGLTNDYVFRAVFQENELENQLNWQDRSLSYPCRSFDHLYKGEAYTEAKPATHIGFLNFTPFQSSPEFNACYKLLNVKNHTLYSDKFALHVVDLTHIELVNEDDKVWKIDYWARLFTATTWEEVRMVAEKDIHMKEAKSEIALLHKRIAELEAQQP